MYFCSLLNSILKIIMNYNQYITSANHYGEILTKWRVYLVAIQEETLSNKKGKVKIKELDNRNDLIQCKGLENYEFYSEIKAIHQLIKKEKEIYSIFLNQTKNPENHGFFTFKSKAKALRNEKFEKIFKKLLSINSEQTTRLNLFIKNLEIAAIKNGESPVNTRSNQEVKLSNKQNNTKKNHKAEEKNTVSVLQQKKATIQEKEIATNKPIVEKSTPAKNLTPKNDESTKDFDYETEMKRILGL